MRVQLEVVLYHAERACRYIFDEKNIIMMQWSTWRVDIDWKKYSWPMVKECWSNLCWLKDAIDRLKRMLAD